MHQQVSNKLWSIYLTGYYSEVERNELVISAVCGMSLQILILSERSQTGGYNSSHAEFLTMYAIEIMLWLGWGVQPFENVEETERGSGEFGDDGYCHYLNYGCFTGADCAFDGGTWL